MTRNIFAIFLCFFSLLFCIGFSCCANQKQINIKNFKNTTSLLSVQYYDAPEVDSIFGQMTEDEKIMQLYMLKINDLYFSNQNKKGKNIIPGAIAMTCDSLSIVAKNVSKFKLLSPFAPICLLENYQSIKDFQIFHRYDLLKNLNDSLITDQALKFLTFSLKKTGINAYCHSQEDNFLFSNFKKSGIINFIYYDSLATSYDTTNTLRLSKLDNIKDLEKVIFSPSDLVISSINPELFLKQTKLLLRKNKKRRQIVDNKILRILKIKYWPYKNYVSRSIEQPILNDSLDRIICRKTNNLIRNDNNYIPINDLSNKELRIIQIGGKQTLNTFLERFACYRDFSFFKVKNNYNDMRKIIIESAHYQMIILICEEIKDNRIFSIINGATTGKRATVVNFGLNNNAEFLKSKSLLESLSQSAYYQDYTAQNLFGGTSINKGIVMPKIRLEYPNFQDCRIDEYFTYKMDSLIDAAIDSMCFPGCQIFVSKNNKVLFEKSYGNFTYDKSPKVTNNSIYDVASLTKVLSCVLGTMKLYDLGLVDVNKNLGAYFNDTKIEYKVDSTRKFEKPEMTIFDVTLSSLLQHRSGIFPFLPISNILAYKSTLRQKLKENQIDASSIDRDSFNNMAFEQFFSSKFDKKNANIMVKENVFLKNEIFDSIYLETRRLTVNPKQKYKYSDVNMVLLQWALDSICQRNFGQRVHEYLKDSIYLPMGLNKMDFLPYRNFNKNDIVPTSNCLWDNELMQGYVHDPSASLLGGISGNAGIFSNAKDIGVLMQMLLNNGVYANHQYLKASTISFFTSMQKGTSRALGFDMAPNNYCSRFSSEQTYGHTGFTGTCLWVDPINNIVIVFLSNRVHPIDNNQKINRYRIRQKVCDIVYQMLGLDKEI